MYIKSFRLQNIRCFKDHELTFQYQPSSVPGSAERQRNWNVIIGDNGTGKSSLLHALGACLMDPGASQKLPLEGWVRAGTTHGMMDMTVVPEAKDDIPAPARPELSPPVGRTVCYAIVRAGSEVKLNGHSRSFATTSLVEPDPEYVALFGDKANALSRDLEYMKRNAFGRGEGCGWVSCGYGPFRRLTGFTTTSVAEKGDLQRRRFATLFDEGAALYDCEHWLLDLDRRAGKRRAATHKKNLADVLASLKDLLPAIKDIKIDDSVRFTWREHGTDLSGLSDGYRSMFGLLVDLLRWLVELRPENSPRPLREMSGVVLIDEVDSHLHPRWQRQVGFLLTAAFPRLQFIVTTHSPFVAMAAGDGALTVLSEADGEVIASQTTPSVRGWAVDRVLADLFDLPSLRDPNTAGKLERYSLLRSEKTRGALSAEKQTELADLTRELDELLRGEPDAPKHQLLDESLRYLADEVAKQRGTPHA